MKLFARNRDTATRNDIPVKKRFLFEFATEAKKLLASFVEKSSELTAETSSQKERRFTYGSKYFGGLFPFTCKATTAAEKGSLSTLVEGNRY